jgi:hypothetical protein
VLDFPEDRFIVTEDVMRGSAPIPSFSLLVALVASTCACAHSSGIPGTTKEASTVATDDRGEPAAPLKLDAPKALAKVLELIRTSKGIDDFTPGRISDVTGLRMNFDGPDRFGAGEPLSNGWSYAFEMDRKTMNGAQFMFSFDPAVPDSWPSPSVTCGTGFEAFSAALEQMGFRKDVWYGEFGGILKYTFDNDLLHVDVMTMADGNPTPGKAARTCVRMVIVN